MVEEPTERLNSKDRLIGLRLNRPEPAQDEHPTSIGPYRVKRPLGMGGMGLVYLAEQAKPVTRDVAVKIIRWGIDSHAVVSRFLAERQVLATLVHPGIASVFDAGTTEDGRPYFVMEYVDGEPLHRYCRSHELDLKSRLELFVDICDAVQHAHHKGVIHRDLKPSNLLVVRNAETGNKPFVKIIDFGIAKSTSQPLLQETLYTQVGQVVGTPQYMSPEQASLGSMDVDTRSDVYALGVILYELLVGQPPIGGTDTELTFDELLRAIRETDVVRPSSRARRSATTASGSTHASHPEVAARGKALKGDLDWITLKALEKDRELRYDSAAALGDDVTRHLQDEPVAAGPPNRRYRMGKFVKRHLVSVALAAAMVMALIIGLISSSVLLVRARAAEKQAVAEQGRAEETLGFLSNMFREADPRRNPGPDLTAKELLKRGLDAVDEQLSEQPQVRNAVLLTLGEVHRNMGLLDEAESAFTRLVETLEQPNQDPMRLTEALHAVARVAKEREQLDDAEGLLRRAVAVWESAEAKDQRVLADVRSDLGAVLNRAGRPNDAKAEYEAALALHQAQPDDPPLNVARAYNSLGVTAARANDFDAAQIWMAKSLEILQAALEPGHASLSTLEMNLSFIYRRTGKLALAVETAQQAVDTTRIAVGNDNPLLADALHNLGSAAMFLGDDALGIASFEEGTAILEAAVGPDNDRTMYQLTGLGRCLLYSGAHADALSVFTRVANQKRNLSQHPDRRDHLASALRGEALAARYLGEIEISRRAAKELLNLADGTPATSAFASAGNLLLAMLDLAEGNATLAEERYRTAHENTECALDGESVTPCSLDGSTREIFRAQYWAALGNVDRAMSHLAATLEQSPLTAWFYKAPEFAPLSGEQRYQELLAEFQNRAR